MLYLVLALVVLGLISALFGIFSHRKGEDEEPLQEGVSCNTCNGENSKCEQECMMEAAIKEIEYYDDEDLDRFAGREADSYTDEEVEEFSEVLFEKAPRGKAMHGFTKNYVRVELSPAFAKEEYDNQLIKVRLGDFNHDKTALKAELVDSL